MKAYDFPNADTPIIAARKRGRGRRRQRGHGLRPHGAAPGRREVHIVYRRTATEMPARIEEVHHAEEEGVEFHLLTAPDRDPRRRARAGCGGMECLQMELGEPDASPAAAARCRSRAASS